ncbi:MAG TPA: lysophospholipid acyltransferase family protein [Aggregatilineales bacterium]|nr:lysophospholipid acyltransferase family protein [Aggregatilineales bacterium]
MLRALFGPPENMPYSVTLSRRVRFTRALCRAFGRFVMFKIVYRLKASGLEKIPTEGPVILLFNHVTLLDPMILLCWINSRDAVALGKVELMNSLFTALVAWAWGTILVRRGEVDRTALKKCLGVINSKEEMLLIAPEGHRHREGLGNPMEGAAMLANQTGASIVPIGVSGAEVTFQNWRRLRRTDLSIHVGDGFRLKPGVSRRDYGLAAQEMMYRLSPLVAPGLRGDYADLSEATMQTIELVNSPMIIAQPSLQADQA